MPQEQWGTQGFGIWATDLNKENGKWLIDSVTNKPWSGSVFLAWSKVSFLAGKYGEYLFEVKVLPKNP